MRAHRRSRTDLRYSLATIFLKEADPVVWARIGERRFGHVNYPYFLTVPLGYSQVWNIDAINSSGVGHSDDRTKTLYPAVYQLLNSACYTLRQ